MKQKVKSRKVEKMDFEKLSFQRYTAPVWAQISASLEIYLLNLHIYQYWLGVPSK